MVAYNTVIDLLGKMGRWEEALQMYQRMRREVRTGPRLPPCAVEPHQGRQRTQGKCAGLAEWQPKQPLLSGELRCLHRALTLTIASGGVRAGPHTSHAHIQHAHDSCQQLRAVEGAAPSSLLRATA